MNLDFGVLEVDVPRKYNTGAKVGQVLLIILTVIFAIGFIGLSGGVQSIIAMVLAFAAGIGAWYVGRFVHIVYEYTYVDRELRVAKILNQEARKRVGQYDLGKMEICAPIHSVHLDNYKHKQLKTVDVSSHSAEQPGKRWEMYFSDMKLVFEPDEKLADVLKTIAPHKVYKD